MSDELAEAERKLREFSGGHWNGDYFAENEAAGVVLQELDRLRAVEKAAAALRYAVAVQLWHVPGPLHAPMDALDLALGAEDWRHPEVRPDDE